MPAIPTGVVALATTIQPLVDAVAAGVEARFGAVAACVESLLGALAMLLQTLGARVVAMGLRDIGAVVVTLFDALAAGIHVLVHALAALVHAVFDPVAAGIQPMLDAVAAILRRHAAGGRHQRDSHCHPDPALHVPVSLHAGRSCGEWKRASARPVDAAPGMFRDRYDGGDRRGEPGMGDGMVALYIFMLAAIAGHVIISRVPVILHTPLMSGSNFIHGIVLIGAMVVLGHADTPLEQGIGFLAVLLGAGNAAGGYVVTERMLEMFKSSRAPGGKA